MEMPKPTEAHRVLEQLAGAWEGEETIHPSPMDPTGGSATGRTRARVALDGFAVVADYEQERDGDVTFRGHAVYTYDPQAHEYALHWFDSMGMPPNAYRGNFEGRDLVLFWSGPMGHCRLTYEFPAAGTLNSRIEFSPDGRQWAPFLTGSYHRRD